MPGRAGSASFFDGFGEFLPFHFGIAVQDHVAEIREQLGGAVAAASETKQLRRFIEEGGGDFAGAETRMVDHIFEKRNVGLDAANAEFAQGAVHALARFGQVMPQAVTFTSSES